jgi:putative metalloprotease
MGLALLALLGVVQAQSFNDLVRTHALGASDDYRIGASYVELAGFLHGAPADPALVRRVERVARRALEASDRPDLVVNVFVADVPDVNAAAYPGGFLVVNRGAAELFDDDELTFVLGHEISHVLLRHYATSENLRVASETLTVAKTAMSAQDRDAALSAAGELERMMARHGKQLEFEADLYGLLYAMRAGVPSAKAISAMKKLEAATGPIPAEFREVASHPDYAERLVELERGRATIEDVHRKFELGRTALSAGADELAVQSFQEFLTLFPRSTAGWTNLAAAHLRQGLAVSADPWLDRVPVRVESEITLRAGGEVHLDRARDACARAMAVDSSRPECLTMLGVMARHAGDLASARTFFTRAHTLAEAGGHEPDASLYVNRGIVEAVDGKPEAALALWAEAGQVEAGEAWSRANHAVLLERQGDLPGAVALWQALLAEGRLTEHAVRALTRLGPAPAPARAPGPLALGPLSPGLTPDAVRAVMGDPEVEDADEAGLQVYWMWPSKGVSTLFMADAATGFECWGPCRFEVKGVKLGSAWGTIYEKLGRPTEEHGEPLLGAGRAAYYASHGLTAFERNGTVARLALWR